MNDEEVKVPESVKTPESKPEPKPTPKPRTDPDKVTLTKAEHERLLASDAWLQRILVVWQGNRHLTHLEKFKNRMAQVIGGEDEASQR